MSVDVASAASSRSSSPDLRSKKRKRSEPTVEELEVDVNAPEPPSKKALRKAKKSKTVPVVPTRNKQTLQTSSELENGAAGIPEASLPKDDEEEKAKPSRRSDHGVWIGNLPWSATKESLRKFLINDIDIADEDVTRIHMPAPSAKAAGTGIQKNKGFAYVDLSTKKALTSALELSETLMTGRRVLIKDAKSFEGRPDKAKEDAKPDAHSGKPPSKRIFVGNLGFDTTKEDLQEHFSRCGDVLDVHLATFEDTGKCKGYGWVEFDIIEAGEAAVRGWINMEQKQDDSDVDDDVGEMETTKQAKPTKKLRPRKWWVNKLQGRPLRMEFAEDKLVRYKKRFGKKASLQQETPLYDAKKAINDSPAATDSPALPTPSSSGNEPRKTYTKRIDARTIPSGRAHAAAPRLQGAIVAGQGKKTALA